MRDTDVADSDLAAARSPPAAERTEPALARKRLPGPLDGFDLVLLVLMVATFVGVAMLPFHPKKFGDRDFHVEAQTFAAFFHGAAPLRDLALTKAPAPSLYYAIPYLLVSPGSLDDVYWRFGFAWTIFWMAVSLLLTRRAAEIFARLVGADARRAVLAGKMAGLMVLASPFSVYYSYAISAEAPAYVGVTLFVYGWARWQDEASPAGVQRRMGYLALLGLIFFLLCRPNAGLLIAIAAIAAFVLGRRGPDLRRHARFAGRCAVCGTVAIVTMLVVGRALPGRSKNVRQSAYLMMNMLQGHFQFRDEPFDWRFWLARYRPDSKDWAAYAVVLDDIRSRSPDHVPSGELLRNWIVADTIAHPFLALRGAAVRIVYGQITLENSVPKETFKMGPLRGPLGYFILHAGINLSNLVLLFASLWALIARRKLLLQLWPLWGTFVGLLLFHAFVYMEPRYLFPVRAIIAVVGSATLAAWVSRLFRRATPAPAT